MSKSDTLFGWPVKVYRHTESRGWETATYEETGQPLLASPCVGGVELRQFRVRIRIFPKEKKDTDTTAATTATESTASLTSKTRCTKRRNLLFLSTCSGHTGSFVLKFQNVRACNEFFDELIELNNQTIEKQQQRKQLTDEETKQKRDKVEEEDNGQEQKRRRQDTLDYLVRLLNDEDFGNFVDQVEKSLKSTEYGTKMLESFQSAKLDNNDNGEEVEQQEE